MKLDLDLELDDVGVKKSLEVVVRIVPLQARGTSFLNTFVHNELTPYYLFINIQDF